MLGLSAKVHIPRWRTLMLWNLARKLPLRTSAGRTRVVWCLHAGAIPSWCCSFDWSLVTTRRQTQLRLAFETWLAAIEQAQQEMLREYRQIRRQLFEFLTAYADAESLLSQADLHLSRLLSSIDEQLRFKELIDRGRSLIREVTNHARSMLYAQASIPIMDVVRLDRDGYVKEEACSLPVFPVIPPEERTQFFTYLEHLRVWNLELATVLKSIV